MPTDIARKPMALKISTPSDGAVIAYRPAMSVLVRICVCWTPTITPSMGVPSGLVTNPVIRIC